MKSRQFAVTLQYQALLIIKNYENISYPFNNW